MNCTIDRHALKDVVFRVGTGLHTALYRRTGGKIWGQMFKQPMMVLTTTGRRSGEPRSTMLMCIKDGERFLAVASYGGDDRDPQWLKNLRANPEATIEVEGETIPVRAAIASPDEKQALWPKVLAAYKGYANYQRRSSRDIPVVILTRR